LFAGLKNKNGRPIVVNPTTLLIPSALEMTGSQLLASPVDVNKYNAVPNPVKGKYTIVSTPMLDAISPVQWYLGNFKRQFVWVEVIPFQVLTRKRGTEDDWNRDVVASYKCRWFGKCAATDYIYVVKSLGTT
ncbi:MAG: Mu-like prophage major head subunit gpT family protein, partial [Dehalococcoidia bacterium]|nr:Mu-like prophage major head subunit gpT family protein [Dehalococcoidia bacterium]